MIITIILKTLPLVKTVLEFWNLPSSQCTDMKVCFTSLESFNFEEKKEIFPSLIHSFTLLFTESLPCSR